MHQWPIGQVVKTAASHAVNIGSNPVWVTSSSSVIQCSKTRKRVFSPVSQFIASARKRFAGLLRGGYKFSLDIENQQCYNSFAVRSRSAFDYKRWVQTHPYELVLIAMRVHLFPCRTQKLSSSAPTILGGRLPGKIGNANTKSQEKSWLLFYLYTAGTGDQVHLFPVAVPGSFLANGAAASSATRSLCFICHWQHSAHSPGKIGNANTKTSTEMWRFFFMQMGTGGELTQEDGVFSLPQWFIFLVR